MLKNELFTQSEKLAAKINISDLIEKQVLEVINSGTFDQSVENGTACGLPKFILYKSLTQYIEELSTSIPPLLLSLLDETPDTNNAIPLLLPQPISQS